MTDNSLSALVQSARQYQLQKMAGPDALLRRGLSGLAGGLQRGWQGMRSRMGQGANQAYQGARQYGPAAAQTTMNAGRQGISRAYQAVRNNPITTGLVGTGIGLAPTGMYDNIGWHMGLTRDPARDYSHYLTGAENERAKFYSSRLHPAQQAYETARQKGTVTPAMLQNLIRLEQQYESGDFGGGLFSPNVKQMYSRAQQAGKEMTQGGQASGLIGQFFGRYGTQEGYDRYAQRVMADYGLHKRPPPGWTAQRQPAVAYDERPFHPSIGGWNAQPTSFDPRSQALADIYSDKVSVPSPW